MKEQIVKAKRKLNKRLFGFGMVDVKTLEFLHLLKVLLHQVHHCHHPLNFT